jgi:hypothetical protein
MANTTLLSDGNPPNPFKRHHAEPSVVCSADRLREMTSLPVRFNRQTVELGPVGQRIFETARFDLSPRPKAQKPAEGQKQ